MPYTEEEEQHYSCECIIYRRDSRIRKQRNVVWARSRSQRRGRKRQKPWVSKKKHFLVRPVRFSEWNEQIRRFFRGHQRVVWRCSPPVCPRQPSEQQQQQQPAKKRDPQNRRIHTAKMSFPPPMAGCVRACVRERKRRAEKRKKKNETQSGRRAGHSENNDILQMIYFVTRSKERRFSIRTGCYNKTIKYSALLKNFPSWAKSEQWRSQEQISLPFDQSKVEQQENKKKPRYLRKKKGEENCNCAWQFSSCLTPSKKSPCCRCSPAAL